MHCFKRLGDRVAARTFERQVVELKIRAASLNRLSQFGRRIWSLRRLWHKSV